MKEKLKVKTPISEVQNSQNVFNNMFDDETNKNLAKIINPVLPPKIVEAEETEGEEESVECSVCYECDKLGMIELQCGHFYHKKCILKWMEDIPKRGDRFLCNRARCPLCRAFIQTKVPEIVIEKVVEVEEKIIINKVKHEDLFIRNLFLEEEEEGVENLNIKFLMKGMFIDDYDFEEEEEEKKKEKRIPPDQEIILIDKLGSSVKEKWEKMCDILLNTEDLIQNNEHKKSLEDDIKNNKRNNNTTTEVTKKRRKELEEFLKNYVFYNCYDCDSLYFGGMKDCERVHGENDKKEDLKDHICADCVKKRNKDFCHEPNCEKHGSTFIVYKCRYCCRIANWFCFGTTHFCEKCHKELQYKVYKCKGPPECDGKHRENGKNAENEQCLGCALCRQR